jgi:hypothetical protein
MEKSKFVRPGEFSVTINQYKRADLLMNLVDWYQIIKCLTEKIRRLTWASDPTPLVFAEIHRTARLAFEISKAEPDDQCKLTDLSKADWELIIRLPCLKAPVFKKLDVYTEALRNDDDVDPSTADKLVKGLTEVFES